MKPVNLELTANELRALFAAVNYAEQQIHSNRVYSYHTILDWEMIYPLLLEKLDKLKEEVN